MLLFLLIFILGGNVSCDYEFTVLGSLIFRAIKDYRKIDILAPGILSFDSLISETVRFHLKYFKNLTLKFAEKRG